MEKYFQVDKQALGKFALNFESTQGEANQLWISFFYDDLFYEDARASETEHEDFYEIDKRSENRAHQYAGVFL